MVTSFQYKRHCATNFITIVLLSMFFTSCLRNEKKVEEVPKKFNVLFISVDDLRPEPGNYGNKIVKTPHLDQLGENSFKCKNRFCAYC